MKKISFGEEAKMHAKSCTNQSHSCGGGRVVSF